MWSQLKCKEQLSCEEITCTMCQNTTDMKKDTEIFLYTAHLLSLLRKVISLSLDNVDLLPRLFISIFWKLFLTKLSATLENSLCCSDSLYPYCSWNNLKLQWYQHQKNNIWLSLFINSQYINELLHCTYKKCVHKYHKFLLLCVETLEVVVPALP